MRILVSTNGKLALISPAGGDLEYLNLDYEHYASWSAGPIFSDGHHILLTSWSMINDWRGEATVLQWIYDFPTRTLERLTIEDREYRWVVPCFLLPDEKQMVVNIMIDDENRIFRMNLDGSGPVAITQRGEGFHYCIYLSPDGSRLACHALGRPFSKMPYHILTANLDGTGRVIIANHPDHLYFGPIWSPDGSRLVYLDCIPKNDPGHDWASICVGRPDGSEHRVLSTEHVHWFATSYGAPEMPINARSTGSNLPSWSPDGKILFTRVQPGSAMPWQWRTGHPDEDHFNRQFLPEQARGGTQLCLIDPVNAAITPITEFEDGRWDSHARYTPDGKHIVFRRGRVGEAASIWMIDADGGNPRHLTSGENKLGAGVVGFVN